VLSINRYARSHCVRRDIELSQSELAILRAYAHGRRQIAERVGLSSRTVGHYLTIAKEKLAANSLAHAALMAVDPNMRNER
jgi:DNA-binding NarL/FixJ family response regulator